MPSRDSDLPIFVVGMMGAGKSAVGAALAAALGRRFVDLDRALEEIAGKSVAEIFAREGEEAFREREARALRSVEVENAVVATGGGVVTRADNVEHLLSRGRVVYLRALPSTILQRLRGDVATRPLLARGDALTTLTELTEQRRPQYERAHHHVDTDGRTPSEIVLLIRALVTE